MFILPCMWLFLFWNIWSIIIWCLERCVLESMLVYIFFVYELTSHLHWNLLFIFIVKPNHGPFISHVLSLISCLTVLLFSFPNGPSLCYSVQILLTFSYSTLKSVLSESIPRSYHPEVLILALTANNTSSLCLFKNVFNILSINF